MSDLARRLIAVVLASAVALGVVRLIGMFAAQMHPLPPDVDPRNLEAVKTALETGAIPFVALGLVTAGWLLAAYIGGRIASSVGRWDGGVWVVALVLTIGVFRLLDASPHPTWMWLAGLAGVPLFVLAAGRQTVHVPTGSNR